MENLTPEQIADIAAKIDALKAESGAPPPAQTQTQAPPPTPAPFSFTAPDGTQFTDPSQLQNYLWQQGQQIQEAQRAAAEAARIAQAQSQNQAQPPTEMDAETWARDLVGKGPKYAIARALDEALGIKNSVEAIRMAMGATLEVGREVENLKRSRFTEARENAAAAFVSNNAETWDGSGDNPAKLFKLVTDLGLADTNPASYEAAYHYGVARGVFQRPEEQNPYAGLTNPFATPNYAPSAPPRLGRNGSPMAPAEADILARAESLDPADLQKLIQQYRG